MLAPLVLSMGWVETRQASAVSAMFNLMHDPKAAPSPTAASHQGSESGNAGFVAQTPANAAAEFMWVGAHYLPDRALKLILAALLMVAGLRMVVI
jgi:hypothetical protein